MSYDLALIRTKAGLKQHELAEKLGWSQAQISRYESSPKSITIAQAELWIEACGMTEESARDLSSSGGRPSNSETSLQVGTPYTKLFERLSFLENHLEEKSPTKSTDSQNAQNGLSEDPYIPERFEEKIEGLRQKPSVVIAGRFDAGKSRLANTLLGSDYLPSGWQPTTAVVTILRDWDDERPKWQQDEVWIMDQDFDPLLWRNEAACNEHRIAAGGVEILQRFGVKKALSEIKDRSAHGLRRPGYALVYLKSPVLKSCVLIDLPGFESQEEHDHILKSLEMGTDILLYACSAIGFLDGRDFSYLANSFRMLFSGNGLESPLASLRRVLIVATHASETRFKQNHIEEILDYGTDRMYRTLFLGEQIEQVLSRSDLRARLFTFWAEEPKRRVDFEAELSDLLSNHLPKLVTDKVDFEIERWKKESSGHFAKQIEVYQGIIRQLDSAPGLYAELQGSKEGFQERLRTAAIQVDKCIEECRHALEQDLEAQIERTFGAEFIESFIRMRFPDQPKEAKTLAMTALLNHIQTKMQDLTEDQNKKLRKAVEKFVEELADHRAKGSFQVDGRKLSIPFDIRGAIAGGAAGLGLGATGAYLFGTHIVALSSLTVLGTSPMAIAFLSAIGGPLTFVVALSGVATLGAWALVSKSWEQRLANKIAAELKKMNALSLIKTQSNQYWENVKDEFGQTVKMIGEKYDTYLDSLEDLLGTRKPAEIEKIVNQLELLKQFFERIPWKDSSRMSPKA